MNIEAFVAACVAIHAPPTSADAQRQRVEAESLLQEFKSSPNAIKDAMDILSSEHGQNQPLVQFHCIATIREVTLMKWSILSPEEKSAPIDFMMTYLWHSYSLIPRYVSNAILQAIVLLIKRGWLERNQAEQQGVVQHIGNQLIQGDSTVIQSLIAAKWLLTFVTEFSSPARAKAMLLPVEFHTTARKQVEVYILKFILQYTVRLLEKLLESIITICASSNAQQNENVELNMPEDQVELLETTFLLFIELLNWNTSGKMSNLKWSLTNSSSVNEDVVNKQLLIAPDAEFREILVRPDFIHSAFNTYAYFRGLQSTKKEHVLHLARQVLLQLASLHGPIFESKVQHQQFMFVIFQGVQVILSSPMLDRIRINPNVNPTSYEIASREMIDMCLLLARLTSNLKLASLMEILEPFTDALAQTSCKLLKLTQEKIQQSLAQGSTNYIDPEDLWEMDGVDLLMDAWVTLASDPSLDSPEASNVVAMFASYSAPVINLYLETRIGLCALEGLADPEDDEVVEDTSTAAEATEKLEIVAALARINALSSANQLLEMGESVLANVLQELSNVDQSNLTILPTSLSQLYEKLCFLIEFIGLYLADGFASERPSIPARLYEVLKSEQSEVLVKLLLFVLNRLFEFEGSRVAQNPNSTVLSPMISEKIFSAATRLSATYLVVDEPLTIGGSSEDGDNKSLNKIANLALSFRQVFDFSLENSHGNELVQFLVHHATIYLTHWPTQPIVMQNCIELLEILTRTKAIIWVLNSNSWRALVSANSTAPSSTSNLNNSLHDSALEQQPLIQSMKKVPSDLRGKLVETFCQAGMATPSEEIRLSHFEQLAAPIQMRLQRIMEIPHLRTNQGVNDILIQDELKLLLELYSGIARAADTSSFEVIYKFCRPALLHVVEVLAIFHGEAQLVNLSLQFFCCVLEFQLCYMSKDQSFDVYVACDRLLQTYSSKNLGKKIVLATAEDEKSSDLLILLQLLTHLITKEFVDYSSQNSLETTNTQVNIVDVVFEGLRHVIPLMTEQALQYPELLKQYFILITYMLDAHPNQVARLHPDLFQLLVQSIIFGIRHVQLEVAKCSCQALGELAGFHWKSVMEKQKSSSTDNMGLRNQLEAHPDIFLLCLKILFELVLAEHYTTDLLDSCAQAMYPMVLVENNRYSQLVDELSQSFCPQAEQRNRLQQEFTNLMSFVTPADIAMGTASTRTHRKQFEKNLYIFVANVRGFLQVK